MNSFKKLLIYSIAIVLGLTLFLVWQQSYVGRDMIPVQDLDIQVTLLNNGDALIEEVWDITPEKGSEMYLKREDLGITEIADFQVTDNGALMEFDPERKQTKEHGPNSCWIIDKTYEDNHEYELCWSINGLKQHIYLVKYTLKNFLTQYSDGSGFYHTFFFGDSFRPLHAKLTITAEGSQLDGAEALTYGFTGKAELNQEVYKVESLNKMGKENYIRTVMTFPETAFPQLVKKDGDWTRMQLAAFAADNSKHKSYGKIRTFLTMIAFPVALLIWVLTLITVFLRSRSINAKDKKSLTFEESAETCRKYNSLYKWMTPLHISLYLILVCLIIGFGRYEPSTFTFNVLITCSVFFLLVLSITSTLSPIYGIPINNGKAVTLENISFPEQKEETGINVNDLVNDLALEEAWALFMILKPKEVTSASLISAYFLKWTAENALESTDKSSSYNELYRFNDTQRSSKRMTQYERELYDFFRQAGNTATVRDLKKLSIKQHKTFLAWIKTTHSAAVDSLKQKGYIDGLYTEDPIWLLCFQPAFTESGVQVAIKAKTFLAMCENKEKIGEILLEAERVQTKKDNESEVTALSEDVIKLMTFAALVSPFEDLETVFQDVEGQIEQNRKHLWKVTMMGGMFGSIVAQATTSAANSIESGSSDGSGGGGASGGGGGGIR